MRYRVMAILFASVFALSSVVADGYGGSTTPPPLNGMPDGDGSEEFRTGSSKWNISFKLGHDFAFSKETRKSKAGLKPELKAKMFGADVHIASGVFSIGNYGSYSTQPLGLDWNKAKQWSLIAFVELFGAEIWRYTKNNVDTPAESKDVENKAPWKNLNWKGPTIRVQVGPIPINITYGLTTSFKTKPKFELDAGNLSASAAYVLNASAAAWVEAAVNLAVVRGGVGAALTIVSGEAGPKLEANISAQTAKVLAYLSVTLLKGEVYAFVDRISVKCCFKKRWKRIVKLSFIKWNGKTYSYTKTLWQHTFAADDDSTSGGSGSQDSESTTTSGGGYSSTSYVNYYGVSKSTACNQATSVYALTGESDNANSCGSGGY